MDNVQKETAEELAAEQIALEEVKEESIRESVVAEYGFDEVDDTERIDKLVAEKVESNKKLSQAIGQKIKHRNDANELRKQVANPPRAKDKETFDSDDSETFDKKVSETVSGVLEKRDLDALDYPDEIKASIQNIADTQKISIKKAVQDPYIVFKLSEYEKEQNTNEAAISRTNRSGGKKAYSFENPPEPDMSTPEGRAEWDKYKAEMIKEGK